MTYKDLFRIAIRLFALASILYSLFTAIPQLFYYVISDAGFLILGFAVTLLAISIIFYFLILKSDSIIEMLRLTKGLDDDKVSLTAISTKNLLEIGIIIVGCTAFIGAFPDFLIECFTWFSQRIRDDNSGLFSFLEPRRDTYIAENFLEVLIGYLLITNFDKVAKFIAPKSDNAS